MKHAPHAVLAALGLTLGAAVAAQEVPQGVVLMNSAKAQWEKTPLGERLLVVGDPAKPGPYVFFLKPRGGQIGATVPHTHPDDRTYTVITGTWHVGFGATFDESKLVALPAGSYYTEPAGVPHFVLVKDEGVVVQITGTGPTRQVPVDAGKK